jgi:hypothetical protein
MVRDHAIVRISIPVDKPRRVMNSNSTVTLAVGTVGVLQALDPICHCLDVSQVGWLRPAQGVRRVVCAGDRGADKDGTQHDCRHNRQF